MASVLLSVAAFALAPGGGVAAVPVALVVLAVGWFVNSSRNRRKVEGVRDLRGQAQMADQDSDEIEFTDRDKQSLYTP